MSNKDLTSAERDQLAKLAELPDDQIDVQDIPEAPAANWRHAPARHCSRRRRRVEVVRGTCRPRLFRRNKPCTSPIYSPGQAADVKPRRPSPLRHQLDPLRSEMLAERVQPPRIIRAEFR